MKHFNFTFKPLGQNALLIEWPNRIEGLILKDILTLQLKVENELSDLVSETINAYNSLTLILRSPYVSPETVKEKVQLIYNSGVGSSSTEQKIWKIPVCYDEAFGIDLGQVAELKNCNIDEIVSLHLKSEYLVYFTGFLPGFLYLGGLHEKLYVPRKSTPRLKIKKGAVAIGGQQTGIYPLESPGGWNIIGNSPLNFFDPLTYPPCFAKAGDYLKFYSVSKSEYNNILSEVTSGVFNPEYEVK